MHDTPCFTPGSKSEKLWWLKRCTIHLALHLAQKKDVLIIEFDCDCILGLAFDAVVIEFVI